MASLVEVVIRAKDEASAAIGKIDTSVKALATSGALMATAGAAVSGAFLAMTTHAANAADEANDAAQRLGTTTQAVAGLKLASDLAGTSFESLSTGMGKLAKDAASGGDKLKDLGISVTDSHGKLKPMDTLLAEVSDKFAGMEDGTGKTATAIDLFGKSGAELIPILNGGSAALNDAAEKANLYHTAIGPEAAAAGDAFNDAAREMQEALDGLSITIGTALVPALTSIVEGMTPVVAGLSGLVAAHPAAVEAVGGLAVAITGAGGLLVGISGLGVALPALSAGLTSMGFAGATVGVQLTALAASPLVAAAAIAALAVEIGYCVKLIIDMNSATAAAAAANQQADEGLTKNITTLKNLGIQYDATGKSISQQEQEVAKLTKEYWEKHRPAVEASTKAHKDSKEEIKAAEVAFKAFRTAVDSVKTAVTGDKDQTRALVTAVRELEAAHISSEVIAKQLGTRFVTIYETLRDTNQAIPPVVAQMAAIETAQKAILAQGPLKLIPADLKQQETDYLAAQARIKTARDLQILAIDGAEAQSVLDMIAGLQSITDAATADNTARVNLSNSLTLLEGVNAGAIATSYEDASTRYDTAWTTATGKIGTGITTAFSDALLHGANFKDDIVSLLSDTGQGMLDSLTAKFVTPFTDALDRIIQNLASMALSAIGLGSGSKGGLLGGITGAGGILGKLGGGGAAAGGGAATGTTGGLSAVGGLLTNPWTIGIAGGALAITAWVKSQAHHEANTVVKNIENPFWSSWGQILPSDQPGVLRALPAMQAQGIGSSLKAMNSNYLSLIEEFRKGGKDEDLVGGQSLSNTQPHVTMALEALRYAVTSGGEIPSFRVGVASLPSDMIAQVHKGERIVNAKDNETWGARLSRIEEKLSQPLTVILNLDGKEVSRGLVNHLYNGTRNEGWVLIGSR